LLQLAEEQGTPTEDGILIKNRPTHQDLANMSGTTRETVSRVLKRLETQGYIIPKSKDLLIIGTDLPISDS
jgi:CRP/FNR family transcriptional regulator, cyclic AMP receptor protein